MNDLSSLLREPRWLYAIGAVAAVLLLLAFYLVVQGNAESAVERRAATTGIAVVAAVAPSAR